MKENEARKRNEKGRTKEKQTKTKEGIETRKTKER
jgi:hypothetical protein